MAVFTNSIGIDVSKDKIDVHDYKLSKHQLFKNNPEGHKNFFGMGERKAWRSVIRHLILL
jgi:transposase